MTRRWSSNADETRSHTAQPNGLRFESRHLIAGDLEATFLPQRGMLCASMTHRGAELLRRVDDLEVAAETGGTAGLPLLHPWANRLASLQYAAAGCNVTLEPESPLLRLDGNGLPNHGVPWSRLNWQPMEMTRTRLAARLQWHGPDLLAVFPYPHELRMEATLSSDALAIAVTMLAGGDSPVPIAFGFHPYFGLPGIPRSQWRLRLPAMRRLVLDPRMIPTGEVEPFAAIDAPLGDRTFDDGFELLDERAQLSIAGGGRCIAVELVEGYRFAQIYAPRHGDLIALEPMTAPANALVSGHGLRLLPPGDSFRATFRVRVNIAE